MPELTQEVDSALRPLIGLQMSIARNAGNMKGLHFGTPRRTERGLVGAYALHIHCPWRMEHSGRIVTASGDYYVPADDNHDEDWEPGAVTGHLQNQIMQSLLQGYDEATRSSVNATDGFIVTDVKADSFGGFQTADDQ